MHDEGPGMKAPDWAAVERRGGELVRPAPRKLALAALGLGLCAALGATPLALFVADGVTRADLPWLVVWGAFVTLTGGLAFRNLVRLGRREPIVGYDALGVHLPGVGVVAWGEIARIRLDEVGPGRATKLLVGIYLHDHRAVLARAGWRRRWEGRVEASAHRAPLAIHHFHLPMELWTLARTLQQRHEQALRAGTNR